MALVARVRRGMLLPAIVGACTLSFLFASIELSNHFLFVFYMLPARAWELGAGVALAVAELNRKRDWLRGVPAQACSLAGLVLMLIPVFRFTSATPFPGAAALPSVLGAVLVIASPFSLINRRLLSAPPLVFIGKISYSWYLWHWPLLVFSRILFENHSPPLISALAVATAFAAAVLSYFMVEQPLRKSSRQPIPLLMRYAAISAVVLAASLAVWGSHGIPRRFPRLFQAEAAQIKAGEVMRTCLVSDDSAQWPLSPACGGAEISSPTVALWGDSHAAAIASGLRAVSAAQGYGLVMVARSGCPPLMGVEIYTPQDPRATPACSQFKRKALDFLDANRNIRIVALMAFWEAPFRPFVNGRGSRRYWLTAGYEKNPPIPTLDASLRAFSRSLATTIRKLHEAGKEVIVFEDVPTFDFDPVLRMRTTMIPARHALAHWLGARNVSDQGFADPLAGPEASGIVSAMRNSVAGLSNVELVDLKPALCHRSGRCAYLDHDTLLYIDSHHMSPDGARYVLRNFRLPVLAEMGK